MYRLCAISCPDITPPRDEPIDFRLISRWENGRSGATVRKEGPALRGLEKKLDELELDLFLALAPKFAPDLDLSNLTQSPSGETGRAALPVASIPPDGAAQTFDDALPGSALLERDQSDEAA